KAKSSTICWRINSMKRKVHLSGWSSLEVSLFRKYSFNNFLTNSFISPALIRIALWWAEMRKRPLIASINVVNRCNLHCAGCYWTKTEREEDREELSLEDGAELIHRLWKRGTRHFFFIGGEPLTARENVERW